MIKNAVHALPLLVFLAIIAVFAALLLGAKKTEIIEKELPPLALPGLTQADLEGDVSLVNFFASWCAPCRAEHHLLIELSRDHGIPVYGIAYKDGPQNMDRYLKELGNPYRKIGRDRKGKAFIEWGLTGVPESFVIGKDGRVRYHHAGVLLPDDIQDTILPLMRELREEE